MEWEGYKKDETKYNTIFYKMPAAINGFHVLFFIPVN